MNDNKLIVHNILQVQTLVWFRMLKEWMPNFAFYLPDGTEERTKQLARPIVFTKTFSFSFAKIGIDF